MTWAFVNNESERTRERVLAAVRRAGTQGITAAEIRLRMLVPLDSIVAHLETLVDRGSIERALHSPEELEPHYVLAQVAGGSLQEDRP